MKNLTEIKRQIELHSPEGIREYFKKGISANEPCNGRPLFYELLGEYTRTPGFKNYVRMFIFIFFDKYIAAIRNMLKDQYN